MQPILDAAVHLADEIARARSHLSALETALDGMKPLLSRMDPQAVQQALGYAGLNSNRRMDAGFVDVVDVAPGPASAPAAAGAAPALEHESAAKAAGVRKYTRKARPTKKAKGSQRKALTQNAARAAKLPTTGTDFWLKCMGKRKQTINEIVDRALAKLTLPETARPTLYNRLNAWLYPKVKAGVLVSPGEKNGIKLFQLA